MSGDDDIGLLKAKVSALEQLLDVYETEVERQSDRLRAALTELASQNNRLSVTSRDLSLANDELNHFAFIASHDLKEPLRAITSFVTLLREHSRASLDEQALEFMAFIVDGATRMRNLIEDLLAYSRLEKRPALVPTDLNRVVEQALKNLAVAVEESSAEVEVKPLPTALMDPRMGELLFQNLLGNALKFRGQSAPRIVVSAADEGSHWRLSVRDNGIGIKPQHLERIFVIFKRLHGADAYPGTGLGLAICKKIVEGGRGRIWAESEPGAGSTFHVTVPKSLDPAAAFDAEAQAGALLRSVESAKDRADQPDQRLRRFVQQGPFFLTVRSATGEYLYVNEHFERIFGDHRPREGVPPPPDPASEALETYDLPGGPVTVLTVRFPFLDVGQRIVIGALGVQVHGAAPVAPAPPPSHI